MQGPLGDTSDVKQNSGQGCRDGRMSGYISNTLITLCNAYNIIKYIYYCISMNTVHQLHFNLHWWYCLQIQQLAQNTVIRLEWHLACQVNRLSPCGCHLVLPGLVITRLFLFFPVSHSWHSALPPGVLYIGNSICLVHLSPNFNPNWQPAQVQGRQPTGHSHN